MIGFKTAVFCLAVACVPLHVGPAPVAAADSPPGIDVLTPIEGMPWTGDRMSGARERLKDILPGKRG